LPDLYTGGQPAVLNSSKAQPAMIEDHFMSAACTPSAVYFKNTSVIVTYKILAL